MIPHLLPLALVFSAPSPWALARPATAPRQGAPAPDVGVRATAYQDCPPLRITLTVGGRTFTIPGPLRCAAGIREQSAGDLQDTGRGFGAQATIYSIGGGSPCSALSAPLPVMAEAANAGIDCVVLPVLSRFVTSAALPEGGGAGPVVLVGDPRRAEDAAPLLGRGPLGGVEREPFEALPAELRAALLEVGPLAGARVSGRVELRFYDRAESPLENRYDFEAYLAADGRIHVRQEVLARAANGELAPRSETVIHDGGVLLLEYGDEPIGLAYPTAGAERSLVARAKLAPYELLRTWLRDPYLVTRLPGTAYESLAAAGELQVLETYPGIRGLGADGTTLYHLGGVEALPRVMAVDYRSATGALRRVRRFDGAMLALGRGRARPARMVEKRWDARGRVIFEQVLTVTDASAMSVEEARLEGWLEPSVDRWYVFP